MSENPEISIIVPVYNVEKYVGECIESILAQTYQNFELILVNDGSTDRSLQVCEDFEKEDKRITIISQSNAGVSNTRNSGLEAVKGNWITFVDSDDWIGSEYLNDLIRNVSEEDYDLVTSGIVYKYPDGLETLIRLNNCGSCDFNVEHEFRAFATQELITSPVAKLYKTNIIKKYKLRFDRHLAYGEDRDFNIEYLRYCHKGLITGYSNYYYRRGLSQSLSTLKKGDLLRGDIIYWNKLFDEFQRRKFMDLDSRKYLTHRLYVFLTDHLSISKYSQKQQQFISHNVNFRFLIKNLKLVNANFIDKYLIAHKHFKGYRLLYHIKNIFH